MCSPCTKFFRFIAPAPEKFLENEKELKKEIEFGVGALSCATDGLDSEELLPLVIRSTRFHLTNCRPHHFKGEQTQSKRAKRDVKLCGGFCNHPAKCECGGEVLPRSKGRFPGTRYVA